MNRTSIALIVAAVAATTVVGCAPTADSATPVVPAVTSANEVAAVADLPAEDSQASRPAVQTAATSEYDRRFGPVATVGESNAAPVPPEARTYSAPSTDADAIARVLPQLGGDHSDAVGPDITIAISGYRFRPLVVRAGATVRWVNEDEQPHTVTAVDGSFDSPEFGADEETSRHFANAGDFAIVCRIHPDMRSVVIVVP
jgi:plastocyanin